MWNAVFYGCTRLTSVTIPNSVTYIGSDTFGGCSSLTSPIYNAHCFVRMPYSYSGSSYTIPDGIEQICGEAFSGSHLSSITIPNSVTRIDNYAFQNCSNLSSIAIPDNVTSIGNYAFAECTKLTSAAIGDGVTSIGNYAFLGCWELASISMGNNVSFIDNSAFKDCKSETNVIIKDIAAWCNIRFGNSESIPTNPHLYSDEKTEIKDLVIPNSVTSIEKYAFFGCKGLSSVTIPNSVLSVYENAFYGCSNLTNLFIGNNVSYIDDSAFILCPKLKNVTINSNNLVSNTTQYFNIASVFDRTYTDYIRVQNYTLGENVTSIGEYAFYNCSGMRSVTIPNSVTTVGINAFERCGNLNKVIVKDLATWCGISFINDHSNDYSNPLIYAHHLYSDENTEITDLVIPNSVTSIGGYAFYGCTGLTSITIPNSVTSIGGYAFSGCSGLTSITIPNSVTSIGEDAFYQCDGLKKVIVEDLAAWCKIRFGNNGNGGVNQPYSNPLYSAQHLYSDENTEITNLIIPSNVTSIYASAFNGCTGLTSVIIPDNVNSIGSHVFRECSGLNSITLGKGISSLGGQVFIGCSELENFYCYCERVPWDGGQLFSIADIGNSTLHVPMSAISDYQSSYSWKGFGNIIALKEGDPDPSSIVIVHSAGISDNIFYDLQGRKISSPQKGIYINNGKKVFVK